MRCGCICRPTWRWAPACRGGLDSSSIVAVAGQLMHTEHGVALERLGEHQQTFSAVYESAGAWNERAYIEQVIGARRARRATRSCHASSGCGTTWTRWSGTRTSRSRSTSIFAQWCVMDLAHGSAA